MVRGNLLLLLALFGQIAVAQVNCLSSASFYFGCPPLVVNFQDLSTGGAVGHYWDFDEVFPSTSVLANPAHTYLSPGSFQVKHIAYFPGGVSDTCYLNIQVFTPPTAYFESANHYGCLPHQAQFQNLSQTGDAALTGRVWDFGSCSPPSSVNNPSLNLSNIGCCNVTLIVQDANGCTSSFTRPGYLCTGTKPIAAFTPSAQTFCSSPAVASFTQQSVSTNGPLAYVWDFDPGASTLPNPNPVLFNGFHNVLLQVTDTLGCTDTASSLLVVADYTAGFTPAWPGACQGIPLQLNNTTQPNFGTAVWDFGDGSPPFTGWNAQHAYSGNGNYSISLTVSYGPCSETVSQPIVVSTPINFQISASDSSACSVPQTITFASSSVGTAYIWNFGDGGSSSAASPVHTYTTPGVYDVTLGLQNAQGCTRVVTNNNFIFLSQPVAQFQVSADTICANTTIQFTETTLSTSPIFSRLWIFGDGTTSSQLNPQHTYSTAGLYQARLIVSNIDGCSDTSNVYPIRVIGPVQASFTVSDNSLCSGQILTTQNTSTGWVTGTRRLWYFGDGDTSFLFSPTHLYQSPGVYPVSLIMLYGDCVDTAGPTLVTLQQPTAGFQVQYNCSNPNEVFFVDTSTGATSYQWLFGDGTTSVISSPSHIFSSADSFLVTQIVYSNLTQCYDTMVQSITTGSVQSFFTANTLSGCSPLNVQFTNLSVGASSWLWYFGDGDSSFLSNPLHLYSDTGTYTVTLIINPGSQCPDTFIRSQYIQVQGAVAKFSGTPLIGCVPLTISFSDSSYSSGGTITSWLWTFGDGDSAFIPNPVHTYMQNGNYTVRLRVTDNLGCSRTLTRNNYAKPRKPQTNFVADTLVCPGEPVQFNHLCGTTANSFVWNFGDGTTSTLPFPQHTYSSPGYYSVSLSAKTSQGCDSTLVKSAYIKVGSINADFVSNSNFTPCPPFAVIFDNLTPRPDLIWTWHFGDGSASLDDEPIKVYFEPGLYTVTLIARDSSGTCSDTISKIQFIQIDGPLIDMNFSEDTGCAPFTVQLTGSTTNYTSLSYDLGAGIGFGPGDNFQLTYTEPGVYYPVAVATDSVGCTVTFNLDTIVVGIVPLPGLPEDTLLCRGNFVSFNLPYGDDFIWQPSSFLTCDTCGQTISQALDTITYTVYASTDLGCFASDTITLYIEELPNLNPGIRFTICRGDTLQLNAGPVSSARWSPLYFMDDSTIVNPKVWPPDSSEYRVTSGNAVGCTVSKLVKVFVVDSVNVSLMPDTLICFGESVQLFTDVVTRSSNGLVFDWSPSFSLDNPSFQNPVASPQSTQLYSLVASGPYCIPDTEQVLIRVSPLPVLKVGDNQTVATGTEVQIYASSPDASSYVWSGAFDSLYCPTCRVTGLQVNVDQVVHMRASNPYGCYSEDSVFLYASDCGGAEGIFVPNTFTPNGDGLHDVLFVRGGAIQKLIYFRLFDRWGNMVFESDRLSEGWNGTYEGKLLSTQTFVYSLQVVCTTGEISERRGNVTLIR